MMQDTVEDQSQRNATWLDIPIKRIDAIASTQARSDARRGEVGKNGVAT